MTITMRPGVTTLAAGTALAESSGSLSAAAWAARVKGSILLRRGRFDEAESAFRAARELFEEIGAASDAGRTQQLEGVAVWQGGDADRAEQIVREAVRVLLLLEERAKAAALLTWDAAASGMLAAWDACIQRAARQRR